LVGNLHRRRAADRGDHAGDPLHFTTFLSFRGGTLTMGDKAPKDKAKKKKIDDKKKSTAKSASEAKSSAKK
jgi:hypothetical protein